MTPATNQTWRINIPQQAAILKHQQAIKLQQQIDYSLLNFWRQPK